MKLKTLNFYNHIIRFYLFSKWNFKNFTSSFSIFCKYSFVYNFPYSFIICVSFIFKLFFIENLKIVYKIEYKIVYNIVNKFNFKNHI